jgi:hypothetical protein
MKTGGVRQLVSPSFLAYDIPKFFKEEIPEGVPILFELRPVSAEGIQVKFRSFYEIEGDNQNISVCGNNLMILFKVYDLNDKIIAAQNNPFLVRLGSSELPAALNVLLNKMNLFSRRVGIFNGKYLQTNMLGNAANLITGAMKNQNYIVEVELLDIIDQSKYN